MKRQANADNILKFVLHQHIKRTIQLHLHKNKDVRPAVFWVPYYKLTVVAEDTIIIYNLHTNPQPPHQNTHTHTPIFFEFDDSHIWFAVHNKCTNNIIHELTN